MIDTRPLFDLELIAEFEEAVIRLASSKSRKNKDNYETLKAELAKRMNQS